MFYIFRAQFRGDKTLPDDDTLVDDDIVKMHNVHSVLGIGDIRNEQWRIPLVAKPASPNLPP